MPENNQKDLVIFKSGNGKIAFNIDFKRETIWATQIQIAELFGVNIPAVSKHISNIYTSGELSPDSTVSKMERVQDEASRQVKRQIDHYNLDVIISVGYRVNSQKATQFRQWATRQLRELITKGFAIDENRFADAQLGALNELIERVRAIRTSEKHFYQKITDIFATTSTDYNKSSDIAQDFFASVQNKFHYAIHQHTAAELIAKRVDSSKINMGLTSWKGGDITLADARVAKNYLQEIELKKLELLCEQFLSYAELMAYEGKSMAMANWVTKLDEFLAFNDRSILKGKGTVSRVDMLQIIQKELDEYKAQHRLN